MTDLSSNTKAIILAAGKGTRMKSKMPKVLHEIFSKPLLGWVLRALDGISPTVVAGYGFEEVEKYLKKQGVENIAHQKEQLGTGHAIMCAKKYFENFRGDVVILCGDTPLITKDTIKKFVEFHKNKNADVTVMSAEFENPFGYGRIVRNSMGYVEKITEEKDADDNIKKIKEVNAGIYCLKWDKIAPLFDEIKNNNAQGEYYLTDIISLSNKHNFKVEGFKIENKDEIFGINSRAQLADAFSIMNKRHLNFLMDEGVTIVDPNSTYISPETSVGADTVIYPSVYIEGENKIGSNCKIGPMAHFRGNSEVGDYSKIGNFVELKNAKIKDHTNACHLTYLGDTEIGCHVNIGAGTILANYNSITKEKNKTEIKDGASIGSNCVLVAPVKIGKDAFTGALSVITRDVEDNSLSLTRSPQKEYKDWTIKKKGLAK